MHQNIWTVDHRVSLIMRTTSGRSRSSVRLLSAKSRKQMRERQLAGPYSQGQHFFTFSSSNARPQQGTQASKEYLGAISNSPSAAAGRNPMKSRRQTLTLPRRRVLRWRTQRYSTQMRFLNSRSMLSSESSSIDAWQPFLERSAATNPSSMPTQELQSARKAGTGLRTWLERSSVGTPSASAIRMRPRISSLIFFQKSFHFLPFRSGSVVSSNGCCRTYAYRQRSTSPCAEIRSGCPWVFFPLGGVLAMRSGGLAFSSMTMSRNSWESSLSLEELFLWSLRRGARRAWMELRMTGQRLCTYLPLLRTSASCSSYPRSPSERYACKRFRAIAFRSSTCSPRSPAPELFPTDFSSDRSENSEKRSAPRDSGTLRREEERWLSLRQLVDWPRKEEKLSSRTERSALAHDPSSRLPASPARFFSDLVCWSGCSGGAVEAGVQSLILRCAVRAAWAEEYGVRRGGGGGGRRGASGARGRRRRRGG